MLPTIVKDDNLVIVDQHPIRFDLTPFYLAENFHALQWYRDYGEEEFNDGTLNHSIDDMSSYQPIIDEYNRLKEIEDNPTPPTEQEKYATLQSQRNGYLNETDWLVTRHRDQMLAVDQHNALTDDEHQELLGWRQSLRGLDDIYTHSDDWVWTPAPEWLVPGYIENYPPEDS